MIKKSINTLFSSIISGVLISIGGIANLSVDNKYLGAFLFSIGLFFIVEYKFKLYTGAIGYLLDNKKQDNLMLIIILLGNLIGCLFVSLLISYTRVYDSISLKAISMVNTKLSDSWYSVLILSIFCGMLIFIGVDNYKKQDNPVSKVFSIIIVVIVFILSSYEHCIANMFYISVANLWNIKSILYIILMIIGNSVGGLFIPIINKIINKTKETN